MNDFETGVAVGYLLHKDSGSSIILDTFTTAQNGHWTAQSGHAWDDITVNVPTYEQEYRQMQAACEEVKDTIKPYDPALPDPWDPIHDPTQPTIPEEIDKIAGYEFPQSTPYADVVLITGGNPVTDNTTGVTVQLINKLEGAGRYAGQVLEFDFFAEVKGTDYFPQEYAGELTGYHIFTMNITVNGTTYTWSPSWDQAGGNLPIYNMEGKPKVASATIDATTGAVEWIINETYDGGTHVYTRRYIGTLNDLIGYGASGHTYKVHNN